MALPQPDLASRPIIYWDRLLTLVVFEATYTVLPMSAGYLVSLQT